jgi:hypothetical protein
MIKGRLVRVFSGAFGLVAAAIAIGVLFSFIEITMTEIESAKQYHGHISVFRGIGAPMLIVTVTIFFGVGAYKLLRRAARSDG